MNKKKIHLITLASWEDRSRLGTKRLIDQMPIASATVFYVDQYSDWTFDNRTVLQDTARAEGISISEVRIAFSTPAQAWECSIIPALDEIPNNVEILVDVSTMQREIIWQVFWLLARRGRTVSYVYHRPEGYGEWLSRDPGKPRLAYKMSGLSKLESRTALVILAGYDIDRVQHLVSTFEPSVTWLGLQKDSVDPKNYQKMKEQREAFGKEASLHLFEADAYENDHGASSVKAAVTSLQKEHNILLASMGPKLSAIALFDLHWQDESLGLVYLPANEFNRDYSFGIGESVFGTFRP